MKVKPRNVNVSGLPSPRRTRFAAAKRPNSIRRVLSGWSDSANLSSRSRIASRKRRASASRSKPATRSVGIAHDDHVARGLAPPPALGPEIEDIVQVDIGKQRRDHRTLPRPLLTDRHRPLFEDARPQPFADQADDALVADPMLDEPNEPFLAHRVEERPDVGVHNPVHLPALDPHHQGVQRVVRPPSGPEPVGEPEEIFLVDGVQHQDGGPLDDLVFQGGDRQRPLLSVRLRYVRPAGRLRPIRSTMDPAVQVFEPKLELRLVVLPRHPILCLAASRTHSSAWVTPARFCIRSVLCWSAFPSAPALGSAASSAGRPAPFVGLVATLAGGLTSLARSSPATAPRLPGAIRPARAPPDGQEISRFPREELEHMPGSQTTPGRAVLALIATVRMAFRHRDIVGARDDESFAARGLAYASPCRRFAPDLAIDGARLGADAVRYSFIVQDFHLILLAGLPAHPCRGRDAHYCAPPS